MKTKLTFIMFSVFAIFLYQGCDDMCGDLKSNPESTYKDSLFVVVPLQKDSLKNVEFTSSYFNSSNAISPVYSFSQNLGDTIKFVITVKTTDSPSSRLPFKSKRTKDFLKVWHSYGEPVDVKLVKKNSKESNSSLR